MPIIRYTWEHEEGHTLTEDGIFEYASDLRKMLLETEPVFKHGAKLLEIKVLNPFQHLHSWRKTHTDRSALRSIYLCDRCGIPGWQHFNVCTGEYGPIYRHEKYKSDRLYETCNDPLKEMPKKLSFG